MIYSKRLQNEKSWTAYINLKVVKNQVCIKDSLLQDTHWDTSTAFCLIYYLLKQTWSFGLIAINVEAQYKYMGGDVRKASN